MSKFADSIQLASKVIEGYYTGSMFNSIYPFTTENISGYIDEFDLKDKSLLTVGSSGDQVINAYFYGCNDVTLMDVNILTRYYYYLKVACILTLDRNEFFEFLRFIDYPKVFKKNYNAFNLNTFEKIKPELMKIDYESYLFWDTLLKKYEPIQIRKELFNDDEYRTTMIEKQNYYLLDNLMYKKCRNFIKDKKPTFIHDDVMNPVTSKKYDNIWLSNICTHLREYHELRHITENMYNLLNDNGTMLAGYLYGMNRSTAYNEDWQVAYDLDVYLKIIQECNPSTIMFPGINGFKFDNPRITDMAVLCKKKIK